MLFYIGVPSLITPVHCITQTEEPEFLELPNGIPSDDTFRRVFERINPEALAKVLSQWLPHLIGSLSGE
ncbi:transposase family protein, partial [Microcystis aeruginosa]